MNGSDKDVEIAKLNMHLADEKKKIHDTKRQQRSVNKSISDKQLRRSTSPNKATYKAAAKELKGTRGALSSAEGIDDLHSMMTQVQDENDQLHGENK